MIYEPSQHLKSLRDRPGHLVLEAESYEVIREPDVHLDWDYEKKVARLASEMAITRQPLTSLRLGETQSIEDYLFRLTERILPLVCDDLKALFFGELNFLPPHITAFAIATHLKEEAIRQGELRGEFTKRGYQISSAA